MSQPETKASEETKTPPESKSSEMDEDVNLSLDELIDKYANGTIDFESDESNAVFEAVARVANKREPLPETPEEIEKFLNSIPLFATKIPERGSPEESPAFQALNKILDETPPHHRAANFKSTGNNAFRLAMRMLEPRPNEGPEDVQKRLNARKQKLHDAKAAYTNGIIVLSEVDFSEHKKLMSQLYSNRAQVQLELENYGRVIEDCRWALKHDQKNVKAYYRAALAGYKLQKLVPAFGMCYQALTRLGLKSDDPERAAFKKLAKDIVDLYKRTEYQLKIKAAEEKAREEKKRKEREALERALEKRNLRVGKFPFENTNTLYDGKIYLDDKKVLHLPLMFLYPEYEQSDYIRDCSEYTKISDVLKMMFPPYTQGPEWDKRNEYVCGNLELSVVIQQADPDTRTPEKKYVVQENMTLGQVLTQLSRQGYVIPGCPTFVVSPIERNPEPAATSKQTVSSSECD